MSTAADLDALRASFRDVLDDAFAGNVIRAHVDKADVRCEPLWNKAVELGWFALLTPERHGGLELGRAVAALLYEELGRVAAPLPMLGSLLGTDVIARFGDVHQQAAWLPRLAGGEIATFDASMDVNSKAFQVKSGRASGYVDNLLDGHAATLLIASAQGSWFLTELERKNVESRELVDRTRGLAKAPVAAEASQLAGEVAKVSSGIRQHLSIALACDSVGGAKAVLDLTVGYLKTREQFGKPIGSFQALKHRCAEHKVAIEAAAALVDEAVARWDAYDADAELYAILAKANACDAYAAVATDAVQLHGGIGFTWEHVCHLYLKRAKLSQVLGGSGAAYRDAAARLMVA